MSHILRAWTKEDKVMIKRLARKVSLPELARHLNRTEAATRVQASKLGIKVTVFGADDRGRAVQRPAPPKADAVETVVAPVAIERALSIYQQLFGQAWGVQQRDGSVAKTFGPYPLVPTKVGNLLLSAIRSLISLAGLGRLNK